MLDGAEYTNACFQAGSPMVIPTHRPFPDANDTRSTCSQISFLESQIGVLEVVANGQRYGDNSQHAAAEMIRTHVNELPTGMLGATNLQIYEHMAHISRQPRNIAQDARTTATSACDRSRLHVPATAMTRR